MEFDNHARGRNEHYKYGWKKKQKSIFFMIFISCFSFCMISFGVIYAALVLHFSKWEDTEKIRSMNRPDINTLIEKEFNNHKGVDYFETYQIKLPKNDTDSFAKHLNDIREVERPNWYLTLYRIRDTVVGPMGLKTSKKNFDTDSKPVEFLVAERFGNFKITAIGENEIVYGDDDKHLAFSCSISRSHHND